MLRHLLPALAVVVLGGVQEDGIRFYAYQLAGKIDLFQHAGDQLTDDDLAVRNLFLIGEDELCISGDIGYEEDCVSFNVIHFSITTMKAI